MIDGRFGDAIYVFDLQGNPKYGGDHLPFRTPVRSRFSIVFVFMSAAITHKARKKRRIDVGTWWKSG